MAIFPDENSPFHLPEDVEARLDQLDAETGLPDLISVYKEIYRKNTRAASKDREYAIKAYKLALCSRRPLYAHELAEAVSLNPDGSSNNYVDRQYVLQICSNFLISDRWTQIRFAHLSVVEFLKGETFGDMFSDSLTHAQAAETCLSCFQPNARLVASERYVERLNAYFFSSYAGMYWPAHCRSTSEDERHHDFLGEHFAEFCSTTKSKPTFIAWMDLCRVRDEIYQRRADMETVASATLSPFFSTLAEALSKTSTALHHFVEWNNLPMASLLVENGADINAVSKAGDMPFHRARSLGHDNIAQFLAKGGCDVREKEGAATHLAQESTGPSLQILINRVRAARGLR